MSRSSHSDGDKTWCQRIYIPQAMDAEMVECDLPTFQKCYLPFYPSEDDIQSTLEHLHRLQYLDIQNDRYQWSHMEQSATCVDKDYKPLEPLERLSQALKSQRLSGIHRQRTCNFKFQQHPNAINPFIQGCWQRPPSRLFPVRICG
jgi:hypothetical protein